MKAKVIIVGAFVLALLLFIALLLTLTHKPPQPVTVWHVRSVHEGNVTAMTFEITNQTTDPYIFNPFEVRVRNGTAWTKFQGFDITKIHPSPKLDPRGVVSYTVNVTNLPAGSLVRFAIRPQKVLLGVVGFVRRAEWNLKTQGGAGRPGIPLNPYDKRSQVFGLPTEVVTEEWVEAGR